MDFSFIPSSHNQFQVAQIHLVISGSKKKKKDWQYSDAKIEDERFQLEHTQQPERNQSDRSLQDPPKKRFEGRILTA